MLKFQQNHYSQKKINGNIVTSVGNNVTVYTASMNLLVKYDEF